MLLFLFFIHFSCYNSVFSENSVNIISREEWWADESYRNLDSVEWKKILWDKNNIKKENNEFISTQQTLLELHTQHIRADVEKYLSIFFQKYLWVENQKIEKENIFWQVQTSNEIRGIILHHTARDYKDSYQEMRDIYYLHALSKQWWDIGYNFVISKKWEIFEGRSWGETAVWAHTRWNNIGNIWISLMGNFSQSEIPKEQKLALNNLMKYLIHKYNIDLSKQIYFHSECLKTDCSQPLVSQLHSPIVWHTDAGHTDCPWEHLYWYLTDIYKYLSYENLENYHVKPIFDKYNIETLHQLKYQIKKKVIIWKLKKQDPRVIELYQQVYIYLELYINNIS